MRVTNTITFTAKDDAEAIRLASERLGRDAVILSSQLVKEGGVLGLFQRSVLRVTAGILEDDEPRQPQPRKQNNMTGASSSISSMDDDTRRENLIAFQKLLEFKERGTMAPAAPTPETMPAPSSELGGEGYITENIKISPEGLRNAYGLTTKPAPPVSPIPVPQAPQVQQVPPPPPSQPVQPVQSSSNISGDDAKILREQVGALADRIDFLLQRLTAVENMNMNANAAPASSRNGGFQTGVIQNYEHAEIEEKLRESEVDEKYIRKLLADYSIMKAKDRNRKISFTKWLATRIHCAGDNGGDAMGGRRIMLIGPTGVGKTTTIAKLAAIKSIWDHQKVLLLTSDTYRIAAVEQLKTYGKILAIPVEVIFNTDAMQSKIDGHEDTDFIFLDTAGRSQRDKKSMGMYVDLYNAFKPDAVHLVLAANMKYRDMLDVVENIPDIPVSHLLFTKLDETLSCGAIFNIQQVMGCPVSFLTIGQKVPLDIETAEGIRIAKFLMESMEIEKERKR